MEIYSREQKKTKAPKDSEPNVRSAHISNDWTGDQWKDDSTKQQGGREQSEPTQIPQLHGWTILVRVVGGVAAVAA